MSETSEPAPGWYPDPAAPTWGLRYWDGVQWTDRTAPRPRSPAAGPTTGEGGGGGGGGGDLSGGDQSAGGEQQAGGEQAGGEHSGPVVPGADDQTAQRTGSAPLGLPPPPAPGHWPVPGWPGGQWPSGGLTSEHPPAGGPPPRHVPAPGPGRAADGTGAPAPRWPAGRRWRARLVTLVSLAVAAVVYLVLPTGPPKDPGTTWFRGGVPGWDDVSLKGWSAEDGNLLHAWAVPGPRFGPDRPFLAVARLMGVVPAGESARSVLQAEQAALVGNNSVTDAQLVALDDGAPGLLWTNPDRLNAAPNIPLTDYSLFALRGESLYGVFFETTTAAFAGERQDVQKVMLSFKATGR